MPMMFGSQPPMLIATATCGSIFPDTSLLSMLVGFFLLLLAPGRPVDVALGRALGSIVCFLPLLDFLAETLELTIVSVYRWFILALQY